MTSVISQFSQPSPKLFQGRGFFPLSLSSRTGLVNGASKNQWRRQSYIRRNIGMGTVGLHDCFCNQLLAHSSHCLRVTFTAMGLPKVTICFCTLAVGISLSM